MSTREVFISTDIEANGPIPGDNSMLSLGAAAFLEDGTMLGTFSVNLEELPGATANDETMEWWAKQGKAYEATRTNQQAPKTAMQAYADWIKDFDGKPVFVGYPTGFDWTWVYWYLIHFLGPKGSPFSFAALDIKSYAMAVLKKPFRETTKNNMPKHWFPKDPHTHIAVEDAIEQGKLFINMMQEHTNEGDDQ